MTKQELRWRSFIDHGEIAAKWKPAGTPTFYIIDPQGVIRYKWAGAPGAKVIDDALEKLMEEAKRWPLISEAFAGDTDEVYGVGVPKPSYHITIYSSSCSSSSSSSVVQENEEDEDEYWRNVSRGQCLRHTDSVRISSIGCPRSWRVSCHEIRGCTQY